MKRRPRIYHTEVQKSAMWDRWQNGESMSDIASSFDRHHTSLENILRGNGGIRPRPRSRSQLALSQIATLVERQTRYVMLAKVDKKDSTTVIDALIKQSQKLPTELYKSLTWDRGSEMHEHKRFTLATDIQVYFCDPKSPWQRGSNENTNRLLRQYFPKGTDLSVHSQRELDRVARQLNERPRKTLEYETPADRFNQCVASTG